MLDTRKQPVSRFSIEFEVANYSDMARAGDVPRDQVRRMTIRGVVDSGASRLVLPKAVAKQLGLRPLRKVRVRYAGGRRALRTEVGDVYVKLAGRDGFFKAVLEPKRETALIGAIVLENLDFLVDCQKEKLVPRDPKFIVAELE
jgi:predicted aspartyl protease